MSRRSFNVRNISSSVRSGSSVSGRSGGSSGGSSQKSTSTPKGSSGSSTSGSKSTAGAAHAREARQTASPSKILPSSGRTQAVSQPVAKNPTSSVVRPSTTPSGSGKSLANGNSTPAITVRNNPTPKPVAEAPRPSSTPRVDSYVKSTPTSSSSTSTTSGGSYYSPASVAQKASSTRATSSSNSVRAQSFVSGVQSKASSSISSSSIKTTTAQELQHKISIPTNPVNSTIGRQEYQKSQLPFTNNTQQIVEARKAAQTENIAKKAAAQAASKTSTTSTKSTSSSSTSSTSSIRTIKVANGKKTVTVSTPNLASAQREGLEKTLDKLGVTQAQRDYVNRSMEQLFLGNFTEEVTLLGTGLQVATAIAGIDLPGDIRDVIHDISNWENSKEHIVKTLIDAAGILPVVGAISKLDEVATVAKAMKPIVESTPLGKNVLKIGTYASELSKNGKKIVQNGAQIIRNIPTNSGKTFMRLVELTKKQGQAFGQKLGKNLGDAFAPEPIVLPNGTLAMMPTPGSALYSAANQIHKGTISLIEKSKEAFGKKLDSIDPNGKNLRGIEKESGKYVKNTDEISASKNISKHVDGLEDLEDIITDGSHITKIGNKKVLLADIKYKTDAGYLYTTDAHGRIIHVDAEDLQLEKAERNLHAQRVVGGDDRIYGDGPDHGGHLIASQFLGSGDIDNLVAMNGDLNTNAWRSMEREWANALKDGKKVKVDIKVNYVGDSLRPESFDIVYRINGVKKTKTFDNVAGGVKNGTKEIGSVA